jgi:selenocysteine-specific elongation factor
LPDAVALAGHEVRLSAEEEEARALLVERAREAGLSGIEVAALAAEIRQDAKGLERMARILVTEQVLDRIGGTLLVAHEHLEALRQEVPRRWPPGSKLDVAAFKEMTGLSRKYAIPLLEYLDRQRITRRAGNDRLVL